MNNIKILEHDGIYTVYQKQLTTDSNGNEIETSVRIQIPIPNPDIPVWEWAKTLSDDEIEVGLQLFFDKWNFTSGKASDRDTYEALYQERSRRNGKQMTITKHNLNIVPKRSYVRIQS